MEIGYKVRTESFDDGDIQQTLEFHDKGTVEKLSEQVIKTKDEDVKTALIKLGWKPPGNHWISVKDRLPETKGNVFSEKDVFCICEYSYEIGRTKHGIWVDMSNKPIDVLYWMYIPELPEELKVNI